MAIARFRLLAFPAAFVAVLPIQHTRSR